MTSKIRLSHAQRVENLQRFAYKGQGDRLAAARAVMPQSATEQSYRVISNWPLYAPSPLHDLSVLARALGVGAVHYKDESERFGLKSFKALGGAYAVQKFVAEALNLPIDKVDEHSLPADHQLVIATATDGNHGRSVAWGAKRLGVPCKVYMHSGVSEFRAQSIAALGATVVRVEGNYDESVRQAAQDAAEHGWQIVSDTAYPGYMDIPRDVMHGYGVMCREILEQIPQPPSHVFICAGCGGLAGAVMGFFLQHWPQTRWIIVEPELAPSLHLSVRNARPSRFEIDEETLMGGLSCGEISHVAWQVLQATDADYLLLPEAVVQPTMEMIAGLGITAGETAVATMAGFCAAVHDGELSVSLGLDENARVLLFGTEGETDPEMYRSLMGFSAVELPQHQDRLYTRFFGT